MIPGLRPRLQRVSSSAASVGYKRQDAARSLLGWLAAGISLDSSEAHRGLPRPERAKLKRGAADQAPSTTAAPPRKKLGGS